MPAQILNAEQTFVDQNGDPLSGGLVYMYFPNTTNFNVTYQDPGGTVPNTNPIVLDQAGRAIIWGVGNYRQVVTDQFGNVQWDQITQAGTAAPISGDIPGDLSVGGSATIGVNLAVGGSITVSGNAQIGQINSTQGNFDYLFADTVGSKTSGAPVNFIANVEMGAIQFSDNNITGASTISGAVLQGNDIYTDHIHSYSVGSITIDDPVYFNGTGGISISSGNNIAGVNDISAVNFTASNAVFTNLLACNGASFVTVNCGIVTSIGDISAQSTFQPTVSVFNTTSSTGFGIANGGSGLSFGSTNSAGALTSQLMFMDASGNLTVNGLNVGGGLTVADLTVNGAFVANGGIESASNIIPLADNTGSVGQGGQRWQIVTGYDAIFQNYITASTDQASPQQAVACLPLVSSINVKTAPHIGIAREDAAAIPGAQISAGGVDGVSNNAIVACLWKALQELNAAFNAYVAAHP